MSVHNRRVVRRGKRGDTTRETGREWGPGERVGTRGRGGTRSEYEDPGEVTGEKERGREKGDMAGEKRW